MPRKKMAEVNGDSSTVKVVKSKRERFLALVGRRVDRVTKALVAAGRMANRAGYEYTKEEADKVMEAVRNAHWRFEEKWTSKEEPTGFRL